VIRRVLLALVLLAPLRALAGDTIPPAILAQPSKAPAPGDPVVVEAEIVDDSGVFDPTVYWRPAGVKEFEAAQMAGEGQVFHASFLPPPGAARVEYYIEAYDKEGNGPARFGAPTLPVKLDLGPPSVAAAPEPKAKPAAVATKPTAKPPAPAAVVADPTAAPDDGRSVDADPRPSWQRPTAIALAGAGVVAVVVGALVLRGAQSDAATFNERFVKEGAFDDGLRSSIAGRQKAGVGVLTAAAALIAAGAVVYTAEF
jgi:hypothetical protein